MSPAKRSGCEFCLEAQEQHQAMVQMQSGLCFDVRDLQGFDDTSKVGLLVFLELWLRTYPLSCGSG